MKKLNKKITLLFVFALLLSICFPLGILSLIYGAKGDTALLVLGIIFTVTGFYVMPILWVYYGERRFFRSLIRIIETENLHTVRLLANHTNKDQRTIRNIIRSMIKSSYLTGYRFENDTLFVNEYIKKPLNKNLTKKCAICGATMIVKDDIFLCEYCGHTTH